MERKPQQMDINFDTGNTPQAKAMEQKENNNIVNPAAQAPELTDNRANVDVSFRILFEELQHAFITRSRKDIAIELKKIENRTSLLQDKINMLHNEVDRLAAVDLETEFKKMQSGLAQIYQVVNGVNNSFNHGVNGIGANVNTGLGATNEAIKKYAESAAKLDEETKSDMLFLEHKIQALADQNKQLRKSVRRNNTIQVVSFLLLLSALIYIIGYQAGIRIPYPF